MLIRGLWLIILVTALPIAAFAALPPAPVPQTGQTACYDAAGTVIACTDTGQDGEFQAGVSWPTQRFVDNADQTVTDKLTGLIWTKDANLMKTRDPSFDADSTAQNGAVTWQHALDYLKKLNTENYLGHNNWRLPNINELQSIINIQQSNSATWLNGQGFSNVQPYGYWSSSTYYASNTYYLYNYTFYAFSVGGIGYVGSYPKTDYYNVWPVRDGDSRTFGSLTIPKTGQTSCYDTSGATISCTSTGQDGELQAGVAWPNPRFTDNGDQTVTDNLTGLIWSKDANSAGGDYKNWQQALDYTKILNSSSYLGYSDWRLPNINELKSLADRSKNSPLPAGHPFSNVQAYSYWSSSTYASDTNFAWYLYMGNGGGVNSIYPKGTSYFLIWLVRSGQYWTFDPLLISASPEFGTIPVGTSATSRQIGISNRSSNEQAVTTIAISGTNASEFTITTGGSNPCGSLSPTLGAGSSCTLMLGFSPANSGLKCAAVDITANSTTNSIPLSGTAITTVYGTVTDQATGSAVSGLTFTLNTSATATTDGAGNYNFGNLPAATYSINVAKTGYQTTSKTGLVVTATTSAKADILLPTVATLNITTTSLPWTSPNVAYSSRVMVAGGTAPYMFSNPYGNLPTGLSLNTTTGTISGTPTGTGSYTFAVGVTDNVFGYSEKEFTLELLSPLQITTASPPSGQQGVSYSSSITANGGKPAYSFTLIEGTLPKGLTLGSNGVLSGTPRESGTFNIKVKLTDSTGRTYDKSYTLTLTAAAALTLNTTTLQQGYIGTYYSTTLSASGGVPPRTFSVTGTLPTGLSLNSSTGVISGTPSAAGLTNLTFTVSDYAYPAAQTAIVTIPFRIWNALSISTTTIPDGTQKTAYSTTLSGIGGVTPHVWSIATGTLPQGITLDSTNGTIVGTPANCGAFPFTARLTDSATVSMRVDKPLTFNIACSNDYIISGNAGVAGATISYSGTASGTVTADGTGNYSIGPLLNGTYTVTPSKPLYVFTPASRTATVNNLDLSAAAFSGAFDTTAPTITAFAIPATASSLTVPVSVFSANDNKAVTGYFLSESTTTPLAADLGWTSTQPGSYTFSTVGSKTLYAFAKDAAGNISPPANASVTITLPAINGACGSSDGQTQGTAPTTNFCTAGTASTLTGTGPWSWTCTGLNGGTNATCAVILLKSGIVNPAPGKTRPDLSDALRALGIATGTITPTAADYAQIDVAPLDSSGRPQGNNILDTYDVIGVLRMVVGLL